MTSLDHGFTIRNLVRNQPIGNRSGDPLPRLLMQLLDRAGQGSTIARAVSRPWASALFQGRRHIIVLALEGGDASARATAFAEGIDEAQWNLSRHFVADISIDDQRPTDSGIEIELAALTIEDW